MTKDEIFLIVKKNILAIMPELAEFTVTIDANLKNLGANSLDRSEIVMQSMRDLKLKLTLVELSKAKDIQGLIDVFYEKMHT